MTKRKAESDKAVIFCVMSTRRRHKRAKLAAVSGPQQQSSTLLLPVAPEGLVWSGAGDIRPDLPGQKRPTVANSTDRSSVAGIRGLDAKKALAVLREARGLVASGYAARAVLWCDKNGRKDGPAAAWSLAGAIQTAGDGQAICFHLRQAVAKVAGHPHLGSVESNPMFGRKEALALLDKTIRLVEGLAKESRRPGPIIGDKPSFVQVQAIRAELAKKRAAYMEKLSRPSREEVAR